MKSCFYVLVAAVLLSCHSKSDTKKETNWVLRSVAKYSNTFTKEGYLDTSYITKYVYEKGALKDSTLSLVLRKYDKNKIVGEQNFTIGKNGNKILKRELEFTYDKNGNILTYALKKGGKLNSFDRYEYDTAGRTLQFINISAGSDDEDVADVDAENDAATASNKYDTTKTVYVYDKENKLTKLVTSDMKGNVIRTDVNLFTGKDPLSSYSLTPNGDTVQRVSYRKDGKYNVEDIKGNELAMTRWMYGSRVMMLIADNSRTKVKAKLINTYKDGLLSEKKVYRAE